MHKPQNRRMQMKLILSLFLALLLALLHTSVAINFLGREVDPAVWSLFKREVDCWTSSGQWVAHPELGLQNLSFEILSPCRYFTYGPRSTCQALFYTESLNHKWEIPSKKCKRDALHPFRYDEFCAAMHQSKGNIMIVGDSMNELLTASLRNLFARVNRSEPCDVPSSRVYSQRIKLSCHSEDIPDVKLFAIRNDHVSLVTTPNFSVAANVYQYPWTHLLREENVSLLILNRGAHYSPDDDFLSGVNETLSFLRDNFPNVSVIWRNTPYGHDYKRYVGHPPLSQPLHLTDRHFGRMPHHYPDFERQNNIVRRLIDEHFPQVLYLDVFTPTVLRADSHLDPLHYCLPGPVDTWVELLFNILALWQVW